MSHYHLILYSKPDCHLCEGLLEKLQALSYPEFSLEVRDITTRPEWFEAYQLEVPILVQVFDGQQIVLPRLSPRASLRQLEQRLDLYLQR